MSPTDRGALDNYDVRRIMRGMSRQIATPGGKLEHAALRLLWEVGQASAPEIYARIGRPNRLVYTSIAKVLDRLHAKGLVSRERVGKAFVYRPLADRETVEREYAANALGRVLGSGPKPAIATLVDAIESLDPNLLDDLARAVNSRRRLRRGS